MIELCSKTKLLCVNFIMYADASKSLIHYNYMIKLGLVILDIPLRETERYCIVRVLKKYLL